VEEKRRIVELTLEPGASVSRVAQAEGVNANQVFQWRRAYRSGELEVTEQLSTALLPVVMTGDRSDRVEMREETPRDVSIEPSSDARPTAAGGAIHIESPGLASISVERGADRALLRVILESVRK
jgi:transposase